jgi:hypothetical protein
MQTRKPDNKMKLRDRRVIRRNIENKQFSDKLVPKLDVNHSTISQVPRHKATTPTKVCG